MPVLVVMLSDAETEMRLAAAMALENMGPAAREAIPALIVALRDPEGEVRQWAAKALGKMGPAAESALPALYRAARNDSLRPTMEEAIRLIREK